MKNNQVENELKEIKKAILAEKAYYRAFPNDRTFGKKDRIMKKLFAFIDEDEKLPTIALLTQYAKDCN